MGQKTPRKILLALGLMGILQWGASLEAKGPTGVDPVRLGADLKSASPAVSVEALAKIKEWFEVDPVDGARQLLWHWGKPLLEAKRYQELAELSLQGIVAAPQDTGQVEELLQLRISALWGRGKADEALQAAKSFFNVARSKQTAQALLLVAKGLEKSHPDEPDVYERFQQEQMAGAATDGTARHSALLDAVVIDKALYAEALTPYEKAEHLNHQALLAYGNLLLLAGRATEANEVFERLESRDAKLLVECLARTMKAQDGTIGRANQYLLGPSL